MENIKESLNRKKLWKPIAFSCVDWIITYNNTNPQMSRLVYFFVRSSFSIYTILLFELIFVRLRKQRRIKDWGKHIEHIEIRYVL